MISTYLRFENGIKYALVDFRRKFVRGEVYMCTCHSNLLSQKDQSCISKDEILNLYKNAMILFIDLPTMNEAIFNLNAIYFSGPSLHGRPRSDHRGVEGFDLSQSG